MTMVQETTERSYKIVFPLNANAWHGYATETLWATQAGEGRFRLENSPFYATGVSYRDNVTVRMNGAELIFASVVAPGGHSTYRILVDPSVPDEVIQGHWEPLEKLGCTYESREGKMRLLAIDVPPEADIFAVYRLLQKGESDGIWSFEEGHCGHQISGR